MPLNHRWIVPLIGHQTLPATVTRKPTMGQSYCCHFSSKAECLKPFNSIPGPKPFPLIGNTWRYLPLIGEHDIEKTVEIGEANLRKYGPLVREALFGSFSILHVFDPTDMETIFRNEGKYPNRRSHRALLKYRHERPDLYSSGGMFPENGAAWYRIRRLVQSIMLNYSRLNQFIPSIDSTADQMITNIYNIRDFSGSIDDFMSHLYRWALETNGCVFVDHRIGCFNRNAQSEGEDLITAIHQTHEAVLNTELAATDLWKYLPKGNYKKLVTSQNQMGSIIAKYLDNRSSGSLSIANQLYQRSEATVKDVFTIIMDLFLASFDTTAFVAAFTLYHLSCNPKCQDQIRSELLTLLPKKSDPVDVQVLAKMKYLKACVKESLRLNPFSIGTGRIATKDINIRGYHIPTGTMIIVHNQVACLQESNFPRSKEFLPERWLSSDKMIWPRPTPFALLPFGHGARMCVGRRLSEMEIYILLAKILRHFQVFYDNDKPFRSKTRFFNVPDGKLRLRFIDLKI